MAGAKLVVLYPLPARRGRFRAGLHRRACADGERKYYERHYEVCRDEGGGNG